MDKINIFFGYSPLHYSVFQYLISKDKKTKWILVSPTNPFDSQNNCFTNILIDNNFSFSNPIKKFFSLIRFRFRLTKHNKGIYSFYTCNELSPFSICIEKNTSFKHGIIIDEGFLKGALLKESKLRRYSFKKFLRMIITFSKRSRFDSVKFKNLITYDPCYFQKILSQDWTVSNINQYLLDTVKYTISKIYNSHTVFILTSPLTENSNSLYFNQEVDIISTFIKKNPTLQFVLKPHYREDFLAKYNSLTKLKNFSFIDSKFIDLPIQDLDFRSFFVVGFHSSALKHIHINGSNTVYTLSNHVNSKHSNSIFESLSENLNYLTQYENLTKDFQSINPR